MTIDESDEHLPVTSYPCLWKAPRKRKQTNVRLADASFEKHVYGRVASSKRRQSVEDFDLCPLKYRGNANTQLTTFLQNVRGRRLGISLLKAESTRYWSTGDTSVTTHGLPNELELKQLSSQVRRKPECE